MQVGVGLLDKGSANGQWWLDNIGSVIGKDFERVGDRQLAGLLIGVWLVLQFAIRTSVISLKEMINTIKYSSSQSVPLWYSQFAMYEELLQ